MKRTNLLLSFLLLLSAVVIGQETSEEFKPSGKASGKVFFNYNYDLTDGATQRSEFQLQRAYLGYKYSFSEKFSAKITLDGGRQVKDTDGEVLAPYSAQVKIAQLDWKVSNAVKLSAGLIGLKQFDTQEKFWGYRYLFKSFQDEFALGTSADLGINAEIKLAEPLKANLFVLNGEGYSKLQDDFGRMRVGGNLIYEPVKGLILKGYYDVYGGDILNDSGIVITDTSAIQTIAFFAGYGTDKFRIGAEYDIQLNGKKFNEIAADHDISGMAIYGTYVINKRYEVFAEWLQFKAATPEGFDDSWSKKKEGDVIVAGIQYAPVKGVKMALNYRTFLFEDSSLTDKSYVYLNLELNF